MNKQFRQEVIKIMAKEQGRTRAVVAQLGNKELMQQWKIRNEITGIRGAAEMATKPNY